MVERNAIRAGQSSVPCEPLYYESEQKIGTGRDGEGGVTAPEETGRWHTPLAFRVRQNRDQIKN
ncbi:MAG: hypothetical protein EBV06_14605 [Planctomycetia bacterium]|nr:hypothetical protein [Planctomycetia bacterium]